MNGLFDQMISKYATPTSETLHNATLEVMQQVALAALYRSGFFDKAAFYGGTCLRIFHGLNRFSEDMDFTLVNKYTSFTLEDYFPAIIAEFEALGREVTITKKEKNTFGKVESAFLKDNTDVYNLQFQTEKSHKIKIEVDTQPPLGFDTEPKLLLQPFSCMIRCLSLPDLFAGKMHALIFRNWGQRVKGRDWYDFEWYVRNQVRLNFNHFQLRALEFNGMELDKEQFHKLLKEKLENTDIELVKKDVRPYITNPSELEIWSNDYFLQLSNLIQFE